MRCRWRRRLRTGVGARRRSSEGPADQNAAEEEPDGKAKQSDGEGEWWVSATKQMCIFTNWLLFYFVFYYNLSLNFVVLSKKLKFGLYSEKKQEGNRLNG